MNYFKHKLRTKKPATIAAWVILGIIAAAGFAILFGFIIMWLWNAIMPDIFGLTEISYWQGVGLLLLSKILIGGFGGGNGSGHKKSSKKKHGSIEQESKKDFSKWELYDKFWEEEGDAAYKAYVKRENGTSNEEE